LQQAAVDKRGHKLQVLRRFFPLFAASLPCPLDELPIFTFAVCCTLSESVEVSSSSISFTFDELDFNLPAPLTLDLPPLFEALPLVLEEETFGGSCLDLPVFGVSCLDLEGLGVLVSSSLDLLALDVTKSSFLDLLAVSEATSDLLPLLGV
jgi:hypothetical protein